MYVVGVSLLSMWYICDTHWMVFSSLLFSVTDALQSVLSSYQPLMGHEKKAFLKPLQQVFPNYEKELQALSKGKMKKSRSIVSAFYFL